MRLAVFSELLVFPAALFISAEHGIEALLQRWAGFFFLKLAQLLPLFHLPGAAGALLKVALHARALGSFEAFVKIIGQPLGNLFTRHNAPHVVSSISAPALSEVQPRSAST